MRAAIITVPGDYHSHAVAWGLRQRGLVCDLIFFTDVPQLTTTSLYPATDSGIRLTTNDDTRNLMSYDRFWLRRPNAMVLPETLDPSDLLIAKSDWRDLLSAFIEVIGQTGAFCINPAEAYHRGHLKALHLDIARRSGLRIPGTLISNSTTDVIDFIRANRMVGKQTIVKGFRNSSWVNDAQQRSTFSTTLIEEESLLGADLQAAPNIFQEYVDKKLEVRLTVMGKSLFAATIDSQKHEKSTLDFRRIGDWSELGCLPINIPENVATAVAAFQHSCNLNFGTMDFIVNEADEWIFLETNTVGNFLWVENICSEIHLLDAMVDFIISGSPEFVYDQKKGNALRLGQFENSLEDGMDVRELIGKEVRTHIRRPSRALQE